MLEVGAQDARRERWPRRRPRLAGPPVLERRQPRADDEMREPHDRVGDRQRRPALEQHVVIAAEQAGGLQHVQGMGERPRVASDDAPDLGRPGAALADRGQHRVVERAIRQPRVLGQQVVGLSEQRVGGVEHALGQPLRELVGATRRAAEQVPVAGGAAHDGVDEQRGLRIADPPEPRGLAVVEGPQQQVQRRASAQRLRAGQQLGHDRQR
ncbi:MAG: hypothetical protein ACRD0K_09855 [Egibacteraceae bacterium]